MPEKSERVWNRKIIRTQVLLFQSNAEFVVENQLQGKDWDVVVSIVTLGDYENVKQFTCKNLTEANALLGKGDEIAKYEFRIWGKEECLSENNIEEATENSYTIDVREIFYRSYVVRAKSKEEAIEKIDKGDITTEIEIISVTKH